MLHLYYLRKWYWNLLLCSVMVDFVFSFDIVVTCLQLLISFVRVKEFIPYHMTTEACNVIAGVTNIDYVLSTISTSFMYIFLAPGVFIIVSMIVPGVPSELYMYIPYLDRQQEDVLWKPFDVMLPIRQKIDSQDMSSDTKRVSHRSVVYSAGSSDTKAEVEDVSSNKELCLKSESDSIKPRFEYSSVFTYTYVSLSLSVVLSPMLQADRLVLWVCKNYFEYLSLELDHQGTEDELLFLAVAQTTYHEDKTAAKKTFWRLCNKFYNPINKQTDEALINEYLVQKHQAQLSLEGDIFALGDSIGGLASHEHYKAFPVFFNLCRCVKQQSDSKRNLRDKGSSPSPPDIQPSRRYSFTFISLCKWIEADIRYYVMSFRAYRCLVEEFLLIELATDVVIKILSYTIGHVTTTVGLSAWLLTAWKMVSSSSSSSSSSYTIITNHYV